MRSVRWHHLVHWGAGGRTGLTLLCGVALALLGCPSFAISLVSTKNSEDSLCPAGHYLSTSKNCSPCPFGSFMAHRSRERSCQSCSQDCREVMHLEVYERCNATSDAKCRCRPGFTCIKYDPAAKSCSKCEPFRGVPAPCKPRTFFNTSSGRCEPHTNCSSLGLVVLTAGNLTHDTVCSRTAAGVEWWHVMMPAAVGLLLLTAVLLLWRPAHRGCLKQIIKFSAADGHKKENQCSPRRLDSISGLLRGTACNHSANVLQGPNLECSPDRPPDAKPASQATGSLGPFHIYSAGTVFVSLLNQVTDAEKVGDRGQRAQRAKGDRLGSATPPSSPPVHLSQEERDEHRDCVFFPSQEQGKETHLSKEEKM
ncbi:tumor necrosis factor receptor superfamily member 5-like isoform X3 [Arapaima gigas]